MNSSHVKFKITWKSITFFTKLVRVWFFSCMDWSMIHDSFFRQKYLGTGFAFKRLVFARMMLHVKSEVNWESVTFFTKLASIWFFPSMDLYMIFVRSFWRKHFWTCFAFKQRTIACMITHMMCKNPRESITFYTKFATVWLFTSVNPNMILHTFFWPKFLRADVYSRVQEFACPYEDEIFPQNEYVH